MYHGSTGNSSLLTITAVKTVSSLFVAVERDKLPRQMTEILRLKCI